MAGMQQFYPDISRTSAAQVPVTQQASFIPQGYYQPQGIRSYQYAAMPAAPVLQAPSIVMQPQQEYQNYQEPAMVYQEPNMTNLGEIVVLSEFPNAIKQVKQALIPWLQQVNIERATKGLHQIGIREQHIKNRKQTVCFAVLDKEKFSRNLVIFAMPGASIRHVNNPSCAMDYKHLYSQINNAQNEVLIFVIGPICDPKINAAGFAVGAQSPDHQQLFDPIIQEGGLFQGDAVGLRLMKTGRLFSFYQFMNEIQFHRLTQLVSRLSSKCHLVDEVRRYRFHR